jgi:ribosomal protein S27E
MENPSKGRPETLEGTAVLRTWVWGPDVHSTLVIVGSGFELRVERDGMVIRSGHFNKVRRALEAAQDWRVDYELHRTRFGDTSALAVRCPECRDEVSVDAQAGDGHRLHCQTCGHVWTY